MSEYTPPNALNIILNFTKDLEPVNAHNLILDFGAEDQEQVLAQVDAVLNVAVLFEAFAQQSKVAAIEAQLNTAILFEAHAAKAVIAQIDTEICTGIDITIDAEAIYQFAQIDSVLNTAMLFDAVAAKGQLAAMDCTASTALSFECFLDVDINHIVGVSKGTSAAFKKALVCCAKTVVPWHKPIVMAIDGAIYYEDGLVTSSSQSLHFEKALTLSESVKLHFEQATGLSADATLVFDQSLTLKKSKSFAYDEADHLAVNRSFDYDEMLKRRRGYTMSHQVAEQFTKTFSFGWDLGLEIITQDTIAWEVADQIHYRKHKIQPWPKPKTPVFEGDPNLNFICLLKPVDAHHVDFDFGHEDCLPQRVKRKWWHILNEIIVTRLDNGEPITVIDGDYETARSRAFWTYNLTVPPTEIAKLQSEDGPVILKLMINGFEHHMLVEGEPEQTIKFAQHMCRINGRSVTALDSATYASKRSYLQENERLSRELCQLELDRVFSDTELDWQIYDDIGWVVPTRSLSYTNLAPIDAIKLVVESAGGFIYSHKASKTLSILPKYKKGYWDGMQFSDYDIILHSDVVLQHDIKPVERLFDYNSIMLINSLGGAKQKVRIINTSADKPLPEVSGPLFTSVSAAGFGKAELCKANLDEIHTFSQIPVSSEIGEMLPGKILAWDGEWWGVIDSVKATFNHREVWETIQVERISRE